MLKKTLKILLLLSLFALLVYGEGNNGSSNNDDIGNIIKNSNQENFQSEKERKRQEKERKKQEREEKKRLKKEKNWGYICLMIMVKNR